MEGIHWDVMYCMTALLEEVTEDDLDSPPPMHIREIAECVYVYMYTFYS